MSLSHRIACVTVPIATFFVAPDCSLVTSSLIIVSGGSACHTFSYICDRTTKNQNLAFPEMQETGGVVVGKGKLGFPGGTQIPPTKVNIVRP